MDNTNHLIALVIMTAVFGTMMMIAFTNLFDNRFVRGLFNVSMVTIFVVVIAIFLTGCSVQYPQVANPRALQWGIGQPHCLFLCFATATATDAEAGSNQTSAVNTNQSADISPEIGVAPQ